MNRILSDLSLIGTFSIATSSTNLFLLRNDGNIGVNNSTPTAKLHLKSSGTQSAFSFKIDNNSNNSLFHVRDDSNVGIGTSSLDDTRLYVRQISTSSTTWGVRSESTGNSILTGETRQGFVYAYSASASNGSINVGYYTTIKDNRTSNRVTANYGGFYIISGTAQNSRGLYLNVSEAQDYNYGVDSVIGGTYGTIHMNFSAQNSANMFGQKYGLNVQLSGSSNISTGIEVSVSGGSDNYSIRTGYGISEFNYLNDSKSDFKIRGSVENDLFFVDSSANSIGVRNQNPSYSLHVLGTVSTTEFRMTNGSATNSILRSNGTGDATWVTLSSLNIATGSGTTNYTPRWLSTNSLSSTSSIYDNGSSVGIGTSVLSNYKLDVAGEIFSSGGMTTHRSISNGQDSTGIRSVIYTANSNYIYGFDSELQSSSTFSVGLRTIVYNAKYNVGLMASIGSQHAAIGAVDYGAILHIGTSATTSNSRGLFINNLSEGTGLKYGSWTRVGGETSSASTGHLVQVFTTTSGVKNGVQILVQQNSTTAYGINSEVSGGNTNYGLYQLITGTGSNTGIYIDSSGSSQSYGIRVNKGTSIFNEFGDANTDFQIEGDTQPYLFFADASTDNLGINNATPSYALHILGTTSTTGFRMTNGSGTTGSIMVSESSGNAIWSPESLISATVSTTNATVTTLCTLPTSSNSAYTVWGYVIGKTISGATAGVGGRVEGTFRNASGTLVSVGVSSTVSEDFSAGNPTFDLSTSGTNIILRVTGIGSHNILWEGVLHYIVI